MLLLATPSILIMIWLCIFLCHQHSVLGEWLYYLWGSARPVSSLRCSDRLWSVMSAVSGLSKSSDALHAAPTSNSRKKGRIILYSIFYSVLLNIFFLLKFFLWNACNRDTSSYMLWISVLDNCITLLYMQCYVLIWMTHVIDCLDFYGYSGDKKLSEPIRQFVNLLIQKFCFSKNTLSTQLGIVRQRIDNQNTVVEITVNIMVFSI